MDTQDTKEQARYEAMELAALLYDIFSDQARENVIIEDGQNNAKQISSE